MKHLALVLALALPALAQDGKSGYDGIKPLVVEYLNASTDDARLAAFEKLKAAGMDDISLTKSQAEGLEKLVLAGNAKVKPKPVRHTIDVDVKGGKMATHIVPPAGISTKPVPLFLALHGGGTAPDYESTKKCSGAMVDWLFKWSGQLGAILVAPSTGTGWGDESGRMAIWNSIAHVQANYNIDPNRVICYGGSMGGWGTCTTVSERPDVFAAACPFIGCADLSERATDLAPMTWYIVIGEKDPFTDSGTAKKTADALKAAGADVTYKVLLGKGHEVPPGEFPEFVAKLRRVSRNMFAPKIARGSGSGRWFWADCGKGTASYEGNTVTVTGDVRTVYLSDRMMDLDKPVKVVKDGEVKWESRPTRTVGVMIREVEATKDRGRTYSVAIEVK